MENILCLRVQPKIFQLTAKYLAAYIQALTDGKEEVFLAVTNINVKILPDEYLLPVEVQRFQKGSLIPAKFLLCHTNFVFRN